MRIAQIAPLHEAVPPKLYGGTERVVSFLTEELVDLGHDVTLFASGNSETSARLEPVWPKALRLDPGVRDTVAPHFLLLETVRADGRSIRRAPLPSRLLVVSAVHPSAHALPDDTSWPARPAGTSAGLRPIPRCPGGLDFRQPAPSAAAGPVHRHGAARTSGRPPFAAAGQAVLSRLPRPHLPGKTPRSRHPYRAPQRHPAEDGGQGRPGGPDLFRGGDPADAEGAGGRAGRRDQRRAEGRHS